MTTKYRFQHEQFYFIRQSPLCVQSFNKRYLFSIYFVFFTRWCTQLRINSFFQNLYFIKTLQTKKVCYYLLLPPFNNIYEFIINKTPKKYQNQPTTRAAENPLQLFNLASILWWALKTNKDNKDENSPITKAIATPI